MYILRVIYMADVKCETVKILDQIIRVSVRAGVRASARVRSRALELWLGLRDRIMC
jgi:hypothetical protein